MLASQFLRDHSRTDPALEASLDPRMCWHLVAPSYSRLSTSALAACFWRKYDPAVNESYYERGEPASTMENHEDRVDQGYISIRPVSLALDALGSSVYKWIIYLVKFLLEFLFSRANKSKSITWHLRWLFQTISDITKLKLKLNKVSLPSTIR